MFQETISHICVASSIFIFTLLHSLTDSVSAGSCWATKMANGHCRNLRRQQMTQAECCALSGFTYWSEAELSSGEVFIYQFIKNGYPQCSSCTDTCTDITCPAGKRCKIKHGQPKCVCAPDCSTNSISQIGPVCGTNMHNYRSHCSLLRYNCRHETNVEVSYYGQCQVGSCDSVRCARPDTHCILDQNSLPHCIRCMTDCPHNTDPLRMVCGADGITYESICHATSTSCLEGREIPIAYKGRCRDAADCSSPNLCESGKTCLMNHATSRPHCVDCNPTCQHTRRQGSPPPLCGTNNRTYKDWCAMRRSSCQVGYLIETRHVGTCDRPLRDQGFVDSSSVEE